MSLTRGDRTELDRLTGMIQGLFDRGGLLLAVLDPEIDAEQIGEELEQRLTTTLELTTAVAIDLVSTPARFKDKVVLLDGREAQPADLGALNTSREFLLDDEVLVVLLVDGRNYARATTQAPDFMALRSGEFYLGLARRLNKVGKELMSRAADIVSEASEHEEQLTRLLQPSPGPHEDYLLVLRQWNSFTPILSSREPEPRGGGYYLNWRGTGIVVDPGHDFVHNLYENGLGIADINAVVLTHDHGDHTQDLDSLLDLTYQLNRRTRGDGQPEHRLSFYLNLSTFQRYSGDLKNLAPTAICEVLYPGKVVQVNSRLVQLRSMAAKHIELGGVEHAVSLRFDLRSPREDEPLGLVFTADTGYHAGLADLVEKAGVVVAHIGTVKEDEVRFREPYNKHLGILGCSLLARDALRNPPVEPPLMLLSEFGEELLDARPALARVVAEDADCQVFAADIGTRVRLDAGARCFVACEHRSMPDGNVCGVPATETFTTLDNRLTHRCSAHPYVRRYKRTF